MASPGEEAGILDYWSIVVRRRGVIYLIVIGGTLLALIGSYLVTPLYRATATLQIERRTPEILTFRDLSQLDYSYAAYKDFYETQYKLLASDTVLERAVQRLGLVDHPLFEAKESRPSLLARLKSLIPKRGTLRPPDPTQRAVRMIRGGLEVSPVRSSYLVRVSWTATESELAADVANAVAKAYVQFKLETQFSTSGQAEEFLVNQIGNLKREIGEKEQQLQEYGESKSIVAIDEANNITLQALKSIAQKRTTAQTELARAQAEFLSINEALAEELPEVVDSPLITRLRQEYARDEAEFHEMSIRFREGWPGLQTQRSKLEQAKARLDTEVGRIATQVKAEARARYEKVLSETLNLESLLQDQEQAAQQLKRDAVEFANIQSEVRKKRETLNTLMGRQNQLALATRLKDLESTSSNVRVLEEASAPAGPFKPRLRLNLVIGFVMSLIVGIALVLLLDYLDNTVGSPEQTARILSFPTLAVIPRYAPGTAPLARGRRKRDTERSGKVDLVAHNDARAGISEAYRELRTSILLSNPGQPPRRIMVTSAMPEEGKTATAINLATVLAQLGKRVLLVDADLRRPRLHLALGVENKRGLSSFLSGLQRDPLELLHESPVPNLSLMPSGPIPPNPSELLNSPTFAELSDEVLSRGFDHVIFDSPPVLSVSDPLIIANGVESGVLVVRANQTPRQSIAMAAEKLENTGGCHFGVVLNDVDKDVLGSAYGTYGQYGDYRHAEEENDAGPTHAVS